LPQPFPASRRTDFKPGMASAKTLVLLTALCHGMELQESCEEENALLQKKSRPSAMLQSPCANETDVNATTVYFFPLPDWLQLVPPDDPDFENLYTSAKEYAMNTPGNGGILDFVIAETTRPGWFHRVFGGPASKCGFWWSIPTQNQDVSDMYQNMTMAEYMYDSGVCPEWNTGEYMVSCQVEAGYKFVAGQGQSATCSDGTIIEPPASLLQVNGDMCAASTNCIVCYFENRTDQIGGSPCHSWA